METGSNAAVLLVDDERTVCTALEMGLSKHGFRVDSVRSVADALVHMASAEYDGLVVDWNLAGRDATELLRAFREHQPECARVVISAMARRHTGYHGQLPQAWLVKPFEVEELVATLRETQSTATTDA